uniref:Secreted protein n=1 Tax=Setaria viridis TaxID=4556 RepID=A0A4V6D3U0_SETVI|nr:hypothetical protein SEVIR_7G071450v2 [Setaria viridis]
MLKALKFLLARLRWLMFGQSVGIPRCGMPQRSSCQRGSFGMEKSRELILEGRTFNCCLLDQDGGCAQG